MAMKMSATWSEMVVSGCREPTGSTSHGRVTSTRSAASMRSSSAASTSTVRAASASPMAPLAWPTRWPASLRACGGNAPISRLARARGDRSPAWSSRACLSASTVSAAPMAANASSRMRSTSSARNGVTSTGS